MGFVNQVKVTAKLLNCRLQPSMDAQVLNIIKMDEIYNIVAEQNGWGQLENGSWIKLEFTVPYKTEEPVETSKDLEIETTAMAAEQPKIIEDTIISAEAVTDTSSEQVVLHKVKKKESLWDIAELYYGKGNGNRYTEIKEFNNLKSDILRATMVLKIPNVQK